MTNKRLYFIKLAEASEHESRAHEAEAVAHQLDPDATEEERGRRHRFYLGLAKSTRARAEAWRKLSRRP
jgi:hypothetical protein